MLFDAAHHVFMFLGILFNAIALVAIAKSTPKSLQDFSIVLFNTALNDLLVMVLHAMLNSRLFLSGFVVAHMANGPCRLVGDYFCKCLFALIHAAIMQTCGIIAISFWYRNRVLRAFGRAFGWCKLQLLIVFAFLPHVPQVCAFLIIVKPRQFIEPFITRLYGAAHSNAFAVYGYIDARELPSLCSIGYLIAFPCIMNIYIFLKRRAVIHSFDRTSYMMSAASREIHHSLVKVITIHALLPSCIIFGFILMFLQMAGLYHSVVAERLEYTIAVFPAMVNPVLTIYFIKPYTVFVTSAISRMFPISFVPNSTFIEAEEDTTTQTTVAAHSTTVL